MSPSTFVSRGMYRYVLTVVAASVFALCTLDPVQARGRHAASAAVLSSESRSASQDSIRA